MTSDSPSTNRFDNTFAGSGNFSAAIPARAGLALRFRMPFYVLPGDLLLASPLYLIDRKKYLNMAVTAANGGLIPWQSGWSTAIGRFQFVLGRELGITFYGLQGSDQLIAPAVDGSGPRIVDFKSVSYDLPILEYRPYRSFSTNQSSSLVIQLFTAADVPRVGFHRLSCGRADAGPAHRVVRRPAPRVRLALLSLNLATGERDASI